MLQWSESSPDDVPGRPDHKAAGWKRTCRARGVIAAAVLSSSLMDAEGLTNTNKLTNKESMQKPERRWRHWLSLAIERHWRKKAKQKQWNSLRSVCNLITISATIILTQHKQDVTRVCCSQSSTSISGSTQHFSSSRPHLSAAVSPVGGLPPDPLPGLAVSYRFT